MTDPTAKRSGILAITARPARGIWRCNVKHLPTRTVHPAGAFTAAQVEELKAEPEIIVEELQDDPGLKESVNGGGEGRIGKGSGKSGPK